MIHIDDSVLTRSAGTNDSTENDSGKSEIWQRGVVNTTNGETHIGF